MTRRRRVFMVRAAVLLLLVVILLATMVLVNRWRNPPPLVISQLMVANGAGYAPTLHVEGSGFNRRPDTLLLPLPAFDLDTPQTLVPRTTLFQLESDGRLGVASARDRRLITLDVQEGRNPRILGSLKLKDGFSGQGTKISSLAQVGTQVVVALSSSAGLLLVDLKDPATPRQLADLQMPGTVGEMLAVNGRIYATAMKNGLWQVTIDNDRLHAEQIPGPKDPLRLASAGNRLVVANLHGDLALYELDDSGRPRLVGLERLPQVVRGVTLGDDALHLCLADGSLREYAISGWPKLEFRGQLQLPGRPLLLLRSENSPLLFCNLIGVGVSIIDVSRAGAPTIVGWLPATQSIADLVAVSGRLLTTSGNGLQIHNVEDLRRQRLHVEFPIASSRERAGLLNWRGKAFIYDPSRVVSLDKPVTGQHRPTVPYGDREMLAVPGDNVVKLYALPENPGKEPVLRASLPVTGQVAGVLLHDGRLYALSKTSLHVFVSDRSGEYRLVSKLDAFDYAQSLAWVDQNYLLVGDKQRGVMLVSTSDAAAPRVVAEQRLPEFINKGFGGVNQLLVSGQRAFVARGDFGVQVLDLASLPELKTVQQIDTPGIARQLAFHDGLLLVADHGRGIQVIDMRDNASRMVATIPIRAFIAGFIATHEELLMCNTVSAVMRLPLPKRLSGARFDDDGRGTIVLPDDLPAGRYRLVVYDETRRASADFTMN
ncbi:MAG: hypothetical protein ACYC9I_04800 [Desulfuromonadales bacterium]